MGFSKEQFMRETDMEIIIQSATDYANKARAANHAAMQALAGNHGPGAREAIDHNCSAVVSWEAVLNALHKLRREWAEAA